MYGCQNSLYKYSIFSFGMKPFPVIILLQNTPLEIERPFLFIFVDLICTFAAPKKNGDPIQVFQWGRNVYLVKKDEGADRRLSKRWPLGKQTFNDL